MWIRSTVDGTTCHGFTCYIGNTCTRTTWTLEPLVTGLVVLLGPQMQGLLETPGLTVAGHLVHGQVKVVPVAGGAFGALFDPLDHRGTSSHVQDIPGAMEALQGALESSSLSNPHLDGSQWFQRLPFELILIPCEPPRL